MTGAEHPDSILPAVAPAPAPQPQPPTQPAAAPTAHPRRLGAWTAEAVLAILVVGFAFLAASFVARNADFWLHLATGRLIAQGRYAFGTDPFAYTTAGVRWVNHAWLYDRIIYLLYRENADAWLVVLKAAMIAALAVFLLMIRRPGKPGWIPAFCTALAVLVMSPQLLLQPRCVSVALLGLTLWLLWRGRAPANPSVPRRRWFGLEIDARAWLVLLCALWVNLDDWFLLCPLLVGLFWIGDRITPADQRPRGMRPTPGWLPPACLAACLCSPYTVFGFTLPADLFPLPFSGGLLHDVRFRLLSASPWQFDAALRSPAGANIAGVAYFLLVALGIASFAVNRSALRDWRGVVWVVFALLGAWSVRLIPFFAVVGGPVAALNWQGMTYELRPAVVKWLRAGCMLFLLTLIGLALPGWLHGFNQKTMQQVAWGVEINPSLRRAAETLHRWRHEGRLGEAERSFCLHPDAACYCAWFCPDEKSFLDARFSLFSGAEDDYLAVCRGLDPSLAPGGAPLAQQGPDWRTVLRNRGVSVVVLYDPDPLRMIGILASLYENPAEWTLLSVDGQAAIVGWNPARSGPITAAEYTAAVSAEAGPTSLVVLGPLGAAQYRPPVREDPFAPLRFDPGRLAFGPADDEAPPAPGSGPGRDPREPDWTSRLGRQPAPAWESTAAQVEIVLFQDANAPEQRRANDRVYLTVGLGYAGLPGLPADSRAPAGLLEAARVTAIQDIRTRLLEKPPDLPLLAVRAARRAVAADPDDANAYRQLAQAYTYLRDETAEHSLSQGYAPLAMLRHVQIATALRQALVVNPDQEAVHQRLADLFLNVKPVPFIDLALDHRRSQLELARRFGRGPHEDADAFKSRIDQLAQQVKEQEKDVQDARDLCEIRFKSIGDDPVAKANTALQLGLAGKALDDVLRKARVEIYGPAVAYRELELLVLTGQTREAKDLLDDEQMRAGKAKLTTYNVSFGGDPGVSYAFPTYEWLLACAASAVGDYDQAEAALAVVDDFLDFALTKGTNPAAAAYAGAVAPDVGAPAGGLAGPLALAWLGKRMKQTQGLYEQADRDRRAGLAAQRADVSTLRALLDLERGAPEDALKLLNAKEAQADAPGAALAREYLKRWNAGR